MKKTLIAPITWRDAIISSDDSSEWRYDRSSTAEWYENKQCFGASITIPNWIENIKVNIIFHKRVDAVPAKSQGLKRLFSSAPPPKLSSLDEGDPIAGYIVQIEPITNNKPATIPLDGDEAAAETARPNQGIDLSVGVTLKELQELFIQLGVTEAINLDGSGSSSIVYIADEPPDKVRQDSPRYVVNAFSDWGTPEGQGTALGSAWTLKPRPAGNHLGFKIRK